MYFQILGDAVLLLHLAFVLFVGLGGLLVLRWPHLAWLHIPAAVWGVAIEFGGWICPLTPLEQGLRQRAGEGAYEGGFIEHYVTAWLYPEGLTRNIQFAMGTGVLLLNAAVYGFLIWRTRQRAQLSR